MSLQCRTLEWSLCLRKVIGSRKFSIMLYSYLVAWSSLILKPLRRGEKWGNTTRTWPFLASRMAPSSGTSYCSEVLKVRLIESSLAGSHISVVYLCGYNSGWSGWEKFYGYNTCTDNYLLSTFIIFRASKNSCCYRFYQLLSGNDLF